MAQQFLPRPVAQHGHHIFVYNNLRTNQVVYSLTRVLKNNAALRQLPYLGKKTVPAALRKDLWLPLATISFKTPAQGLTAFRKLREFRRLHETAYPLELVRQKEGKNKGLLMGKKQRGRVLMDQKANSVADMAAVLIQQEKDEQEAAAAAAAEAKNADEERSVHVGKGKKKKKKVAAATTAPTVADSTSTSTSTSTSPLTEVGASEKVSTETQEGQTEIKAAAEGENKSATTQGVRIRWSNLLDAQFAETWPASVVHDRLMKDGYTPAHPDEEIVESDAVAEAPIEPAPDTSKVEVAAS